MADTSTSFVSVMEKIAEDLGKGAAAAYAAARWPGRTLSVKTFFKPRVKITQDELPLIMITRPVVEKGARAVSERSYKQDLRVYFGFMQNDLSLAGKQAVAFEEAIEDDFLKYRPEGELGGIGLPAGCNDIETKESANDEGHYHPTYFGVMRVEIDFVRTIGG